MTSRSSAFWAGFFCVVSALVCGCGGNSNQTTQQTAPSALSYAQPSIAAVVGEAISADTPTVTGTVTAYSVNPALPSGFTLNSTSGTIAGTPSAVTATATYTVTASNAAGSTTAAVKIAVAVAAVQPPSGLTYPQTTISATVGQTITADTPTVTGTVTSYAVNPGLPAGLAIDATAGTISGAPTAASASAAYVVTASNASGSTTATIQIAIAAAAPPPATFQYVYGSLQGQADAAIQTDIPSGSYTFTATTFTVSPALPAGLLMSNSTGEIYGTPTAASSATSYTVTATNSSGVATATVQITIIAELVPSLQYHQTTIGAYVGQSIAPDSVYESGYGGPVSSWSVSPALPAGLNLSQTTGTIAGTPLTVTRSATYTVTASNAAGSASLPVQISVGALQAPTAIVYPQTSIATYTGQAITPDIPGISGGPVASYSISPALPAGLNFNQSTGIISGTPTGTSAQASYVVTVTNTAGSIASAPVTITITAKPIVLMQVGFSSGPLAFANGSVLSGGGYSSSADDSFSPWTLWNYQTGAMLATGDAGLGGKSISAGGNFGQYDQMAGPTAAIQVPGGIEVLSSSDGHLLGIVAAPDYMYGLPPNAPPPNPPTTVGLNQNDLWQLASDGSYIAMETGAGLHIYAPSGQLLYQKAGDYYEPAANVLVPYNVSTLGIQALPGHVLVANGPAAPNAIETLTVPSGMSTVASPYQGQFYQWFGDGAHFFSEYGYDQDGGSQAPLPDATVYVYSSSSMQVAQTQPANLCLGGWGNWIWNSCPSDNAYGLTISAIGSSTPALTYPYLDCKFALSSGPTVAILPDGNQQQVTTVIDLSGSTPVATNYTLPPFTDNDCNGYSSATYAAQSGSQWVLDLFNNGFLDGASLQSGTPRFIGSGLITSIAGGANRTAIATGGEQVTWFDPSNTTPQGSETSASGYTDLSTDGTVMAAASLDGTLLNFYSLPSGTVTNSSSDPSAAGQNFSLSLSGSGTTYGTVVGYVDKNGGSYTVRVAPVSGGANILSITQPQLQPPVAISPDGTLVAFCCDAANPANSLIYKNGSQVASVPGLATGWIDNNRLLAWLPSTPNYIPGSVYVIYSPSGTVLANPPLPYFWLPFQTVTSDTIYLSELNGIYSLTTGQPTWTSPYHADGDSTQWGPGAVTGNYVVFESEGNVLAVPWQ